MEHKNKKAKLTDVLKAFWNGIKPYRLFFYATLLIFATGNIVQIIVPLFYKRFFDILTTSGADKASVAPELVHILFMVLIFNGTVWALYRVGHFSNQHFEAMVMARLKQISFDYLIDHSYIFFSNTFTGSLVQRISRFSRAFERLFDTLVFSFVPLLINIIGVVVVVWFQKPLISYVILIWVVLIMAFNYFFSRWKLKYDIASAAADSATTARLSDAIGNQNTISSFTGSQYESEAFKAVSTKQAHATRLSWNLSSILDSVQAGLIVIVEFLLFYYTVVYWKEGTVTVGTFVLIQVYIIGLAQKLWDLGRIIRTVYEGFADSQEMVDILLTPHEIKDVPGAKPLHVKDGKVEFRDVNFSFNTRQPILQEVNLMVQGGEKIALIGPSGAGKSTFVKLLLRMYNLTQGMITIEGQDIQNVTQRSLRNAISLVPQDPILFHRTLLENIRYGRRDATDEEVIAAAKLAHCDEFIDVLPLKYETYVGERGIKLSGGERQRVAIARTILKNAPILILDEATSSLDSHSESLIQDALDKLMKGRTTIVIAHRLSTIRKMDRIIVLASGKIIEEGTHDDLVKKEGSLYKHLWNLQAGGFLAE